MSYKQLPEYGINSAHWRAAANENMAYTSDFPECLLTLPEAYDGAISQGKASHVKTIVDLNTSNPSVGELIIEDNGFGLMNEDSLTRLLSWASKTSTSSHHRYGHGSKKFLTKWGKEYETAIWKIESRTKSRRGGNHTNDMIEIKAPFLGMKTERKETDDTKSLNPSGLRWTLQFDKAILKDLADPKKLFDAIREIICTWYSNSILKKIRFELVVKGSGSALYQGDSSLWLGLDQALKREVEAKRAEILRGPFTGKFNSGGSETWVACDYRVNDDSVLKKNFPVFGRRSRECSRVHMALNGRFIEHMHLSNMLGITDHNSLNGRISIVYFISEDDKYDNLPTPATTKVAFSESCPIFIDFQKKFREFISSKENTVQEQKEKIPLTEENIHKMKLSELQDWCSAKKLSKYGNKSQLVTRLLECIKPKESEEAKKAKKAQAEEAKKAQAEEAKKAQAKKAEEAQAKKADEAQAEEAKKAQAKKAEEAQAQKAREAQAKKAEEDQAQKAREAQAKKAEEAEAQKAREAQAKKAEEDQAQKAREVQDEEAKKAEEAQAEEDQVSNAIHFTIQGHTICVKGGVDILFTIPCIVEPPMMLTILDHCMKTYGKDKFLKWIPEFINTNLLLHKN